MTAQQLLQSSASTLTGSDSSSMIIDDADTTALLSRASSLSASLMAVMNFAELPPTKQADMLVKLMNLEYRILAQRNQARKLAIQSGEKTKRSARTEDRSTSQPLSEMDKTNDPVALSEQLPASDYSDLLALPESPTLEQNSIADEVIATSQSPDERQPATKNLPIDTASHELQCEQAAVTEVTDNEPTYDACPSSPCDVVDYSVEPACQEEVDEVAAQDGSHPQSTSTSLIEKKGVAQRQAMGKKKGATTNNKTFSSSRPGKKKGRKR